MRQKGFLLRTEIMILLISLPYAIVHKIYYTSEIFVLLDEPCSLYHILLSVFRKKHTKQTILNMA